MINTPNCKQKHGNLARPASVTSCVLISATGQRIWLRPGQEVVVGRSEVCDFVVADDRVSSQHFLLRCQSDACLLRDIESTNGVFVNGQQAHEAILCDGDLIRAGSTEFTVTITGGDAQSVGTKERIVPATTCVASKGTETATPAWQYAEDHLANGFSEFYGLGKQPTPVELINLLKEAGPLRLIVDYPTLGIPRPSEIEQPVYLFDWLPSDIAHDVSPLLISANDIELDKVINPCWGHDALICLYTDLDAGAILEHFRGAARGYHLPTTMANALSLGGELHVGQLMEDIGLVLVEADGPTKWRSFGKGQLRAMFNKLGFQVIAVA